MIFSPRTVEIPNRYSIHLPPGITASTLVEAASAMEKQFGAPTFSVVDGELIEMYHELEDRDVRFYKYGSSLVGVRSNPKPRAKAFFRACSGYGGSLTATGAATGFALLLPQLTTLAQATAHFFYYRALPGATAVCTPCVCIPVGPYPSAISVVPAGVLQVTVTVDVTGQLFCL